jgi:aryl-alcohol dehydrogenase-like predicted oxidoreductase
VSWLSPSELRVGLGCMRLEPDDEATILAAVEAGITVFDTARSYEGNEELLGRALRGVGAARVVTKGGMSRPDGAWIPDGRAKSIRADCEASLAALDGLGIDLYLLHVPDPRTPWKTSLRALAKLLEAGLVPRVGVSNVNRDQLDEALELAPISAVEIALSPFDDAALRGGVVDRCIDAGITVIAHSPLGGPRRAKRLGRLEPFATVAAEHGEPVAEIALAWLLGLAPNLVAIPGARRPEAASSAARAASLQLTADDRQRLGGRRRRPRAVAAQGDVVVVMGVPGAGKSRVAEGFAGHGYVRLNRDERGGTLRDLAGALEEALSSGERRVVLDNTYLTRASRSYVVETAARHGVRARCTWLDTPLAQAQVNLVERLLHRLGRLPTPEELKRLARQEPGLLAPTSQMRAFRELEPPSEDEGFASVEHVAFERRPHPEQTRAGVFVAAGAIGRAGWEECLAEVDPAAPHLVFDWIPDGSASELERLVAKVADAVAGPVEAAFCPHPGGPPICWCRPPLPGLPVAFARAHGVELARSIVIGVSPAHRTLANALGARSVLL